MPPAPRSFWTRNLAPTPTPAPPPPAAPPDTTPARRRKDPVRATRLHPAGVVAPDPPAPPGEASPATGGGSLPRAGDLVAGWLQAGGGAMALEALIGRVQGGAIETCATLLEARAAGLDREGPLHADAAQTLRWAAGLLREERRTGYP